MWCEKEWWLLAAAVLLFFRRPLTTGTFFFRDLHFLHYAKKLMWLAAIRSGELPLWDPLAQGGQPFLGDPQSTVFYPSNLLYLVLPPLAAFNISIVLQYLLCAFGAYWLARVLGLSAAAAFVAGAVFALCGYTLSTANLFLPLLGIAWLPVVLASCESFFETRRTRWAVAAIVAGAMPVFGGAPEVALMTYLTVGLWVIARPGAPRLRIAFLMILFAGIIGVALVQIVPTLEMIRESSRGQGIELTGFGGWSVDPRRLPELVVPEFLGPTKYLNEARYWGRAIEDDGFPYILSFYFGFAALLLAAVGLSSGTTQFPRRLRLLLFALIAFGVFLALGRNEPLFEIVHRLPLLSVFRFPVKAVALTALPVALLAAAGLDALRAGASRAAAVIAWIGAAVLTLTTIGVATSEWFAAGLQQFFFHAASAGVTGALASRLVHASIVALASAALVSLARTKFNAPLPMLCALLVVADLVVAGGPVNDYAPRDFYDPPSTLNAVRAVVDGGRLYRMPNPAEVSLKAPSDDIVWYSRWNLEVLTDYTALLYGIPLVFHQDFGALGPRRTVELADLVGAVPWAKRFPILAAAGCRAAMTADLLRSRQPRAVVSNASNRPFYVYAVDGRPAWFSSNVEIADDGRALEIMRRSAGTIPLILAPPARRVPPCGEAPVMFREKTRNHARLAVEAPCDGYVVLPQSFYPGWRASVDGHAARIDRADYAFSAVYVGSGRHSVEFTYRPASVIVGAAGTAGTLLVIVVAALLRHRARKGPGPNV